MTSGLAALTLAQRAAVMQGPAHPPSGTAQAHGEQERAQEPDCSRG